MSVTSVAFPPTYMADSSKMKCCCENDPTCRHRVHPRLGCLSDDKRSLWLMRGGYSGEKLDGLNPYSNIYTGSQTEQLHCFEETQSATKIYCPPK